MRHTNENTYFTAREDMLTYLVKYLFDTPFGHQQTESVHESCDDRVKSTSIYFPSLIISLTLCPTAPLQKCNASADRLFQNGLPRVLSSSVNEHKECPQLNLNLSSVKQKSPAIPKTQGLTDTNDNKWENTNIS